MHITGDVADNSAITLEMTTTPPVNIASMYLFMGMMSIPGAQEGSLHVIVLCFEIIIIFVFTISHFIFFASRKCQCQMSIIRKCIMQILIFQL